MRSFVSSRSTLVALAVVLSTAGVSSALTACSAGPTSPYFNGKSFGGGSDDEGDDEEGSGSGNGSGNGSGSRNPSTNNGNGNNASTTTGGGASTTGGSAVRAPAFDLLVAAPATLDLNAETTVQITVAPKEGYAGPVALSTTGLPSGVTATFDNATVNVAGTAGATATLTLKATTSAATGANTFQIVGTAGATTKQAPGNLTVNPRLVVTIPANANANQGSQGDPRTDAFGPYPMTVTAPANISSQNPFVIVFKNADSTPHQIHAGQAGIGFPHGNSNIPAGGQENERRVTSRATLNFYLHDQGTANTVGQIVIQ